MLTYEFADNIGSITYLELIPLNAITQIGWAYKGKSVGFQYDNTKSLKVGFLPGEARLSENLKPNDPGGEKVSITISFIVPHEDEDAHKWINANKKGRFLAITVDGNGYSRLSGLVEQPITFSEIGFSTGKSYTNRNVNVFTLSVTAPQKSLRLGFTKVIQTPNTSNGSGLPETLTNVTNFRVGYTEPENDFLSIEFEAGSGDTNDPLEVWVKNLDTGQNQLYGADFGHVRGDAGGGSDYDPIIPFEIGHKLKIEYWVTNQVRSEASPLQYIEHVVGGINNVFVDDIDPPSVVIAFSPGTNNPTKQSDLVRFRITNLSTGQAQVFKPNTRRDAGYADLTGLVMESGHRLKVEYWVVSAANQDAMAPTGTFFYQIT